MKQNRKKLWQRATISQLPMTLLFGVLLAASTHSYSQSTTNTNAQLPLARMEHNNFVTIRSGLNPTYEIHVGHLNFSTSQDAVAYFQARDVDYIDFVVVDKKTVLMHLDLSNPAVANWTMADWNQALASRAANSTPRALPTN